MNTVHYYKLSSISLFSPDELGKYKIEDAEVEDDDKKERKKQVLIKRISIAIVLLIKENPILPVSFKYEGQCLLEKLKAERDAYKRKRENEKR